MKIEKWNLKKSDSFLSYLIFIFQSLKIDFHQNKIYSKSLENNSVKKIL